MKKLYFIIILFVTCSVCCAQNLVPNGTFEDSSWVICGYTINAGQFNNSAYGWTSPNTATPDLHSTLIPQSCVNHHPNSLFPGCTSGSQFPYSGNNFAGIITYAATNPPWREYIQTHLLTPMVPGMTYNVELYVSLGDQSQKATNNIGVGFSTTSTYISNYNYLGYTPQLLFTNVIGDTVNWVLLKDTIVASQPYEYIIIGNFFDDANTNIVTVNPSACMDRAYYYIDDVGISVDTTVSMEEIQESAAVVLYPNPVNEKLHIKINNNYCSDFLLHDIASKILLQQSFTNTVSINTEQLAKGIYFYEVRNKNGVVRKGMVMKD